MFKKVLFGALALCSTVLLMPTVADAAGPEVERNTSSSTTTLPDLCGDGADLTFDVESKSVSHTFTDADGNEIRTLTQFNARQTITRSDTGNTVKRQFQQTVTSTPGEGFSFSGVFAIVAVPGEGPILLEAGREVRDINFDLILEAGPKIDLSEFIGTLCDGLA